MAVDRFTKSRFYVQILLTAAASALVASIFALLDPDRSDRLSKATAYAGLFYLAVTLVVGPLNVLRGVPNPLSSYLRRDLGIIAGALALIHTFLGLQVHMRGDFIQYFFYRTPTNIGTLRFDLFGIVNQLGLIAALIAFVLLCISNNWSIREIGPTGWKRIQRLNYIGAVLVVVHGLLYQLIEQRKFVFIAYVFGVSAIAAIVQILGFRRRRRQMAKSIGH